VTVKTSLKHLIDFRTKGLSNAVLHFQRVGPPHPCFAIEDRL